MPAMSPCTFVSQTAQHCTYTSTLITEISNVFIVCLICRDVLKFHVVDVEPKYYADGEDAYAMKRPLVSV